MKYKIEYEGYPDTIVEGKAAATEQVQDAYAIVDLRQRNVGGDEVEFRNANHDLIARIFPIA